MIHAQSWLDRRQRFFRFEILAASQLFLFLAIPANSCECEKLSQCYLFNIIGPVSAFNGAVRSNVLTSLEDRLHQGQLSQKAVL